MRRYLTTISASLFLTLILSSNKALAAPDLKSKEEIINFQKAHGLKPDGIIGKRTRAALKVESKKTEISLINSPLDNNPSTPAISIKRTTLRPKKVVKIEEKCQFLFWELECAKTESSANAKTNTTNIKAQTKVVEKGLTMVGMDVKTDRKELEQKFTTAFGFKVDPARIPWCAAWANTVLASVGLEGTKSLAARSFLAWGEPVKNPSEGDIVVMRRGHNKWAGHVGFYINTVEYDGRQYIAVLGGNQAHSVSIAYYDAKRVLGYRKSIRS